MQTEKNSSLAGKGCWCYAEVLQGSMNFYFSPWLPWTVLNGTYFLTLFWFLLKSLYFPEFHRLCSQLA